MNSIEEFNEQLILREHKEEQLALEALSNLLKTHEGVDLLKYLFKNFEVGQLPDRGLSPEDHQEALGFLRAGNSIFNFAVQADAQSAASILANIEKEKIQDERTRFSIEHNITIPEPSTDY